MELKKVTTLTWRRFLQTEAGIEGLLFLREKTPGIVKGLPHEVQFDAGYTQGYMKALDTISEIIAVRAQDSGDASNDD
jgi:hypothetical protein